MSRLDGTEWQEADHRKPRVSLLQLGPEPEESTGPVQGRRPGRLLSPGGQAGRQAARQGTERRVPGRAGLQGGRGAAAVREGGQHPPRPRQRTWASATPTWPRYPQQEAADRRQGRGA